MAADVKISALQALGALAGPDLFVVVDVSDTGMALTGTDKRLTATTLAAYLATTLQISGVNTGDLTITSGTGLGLAGQLLSLDAATELIPGVLTVGAQNISGVKSFVSQVIMAQGLTITGTIVGNGGMTSSAGSSVLTITESFMKGTRGTARWSLNEAGGGTAQLYNTSAGVEVSVAATSVYGRGTQSTDVATVFGTTTADASVHGAAKIASWGTGVGGTYLERMFMRKVQALDAVLTIDTNTMTNAGALLIKNNGIGYSGIWFNSLSEVQMGIGSGGTLGFAIQSTNRTQSFIVNSDAFSPSAVGIFYFQSSDSVAMRAKDTMRVTSDAAHTGNMAAWYLGATAVMRMDIAGNLLGTSGALTLNNSVGARISYSSSSFTADANATVLGGAQARVSGLDGTGASDTSTLVGTAAADGTVHASAKMVSFGTGIGGSYTEYMHLKKGILTFAGDRAWVVATDPNGASNHWEWRFRSGLDMTWGNNSSVYFGCDISDGYVYSAFGFKALALGITYFKVAVGNGRIDQWGTDSTGTAGAVTIDKPTGKSSILAGAASVVVTNNLVTAASRIIFSPHARDATCKELIVVAGAGFFTVSGSAAATANLPFSWQVANIL